MNKSGRGTGSVDNIEVARKLYTALFINTDSPCPFCQMPAERIAGGNELGLIVRDAFPVSPGHRLIPGAGCAG